MPFTPFHLGFGAVVKAIVPARFSFLIFAGSQVLMDIEPGVRMLQDSAILHGPSHTYLGALVVGSVAAILGKPITEFVLRQFKVRNYELTWQSVRISSLVGTFSHVLLDSIMHVDMVPFLPFTDGNPLIGLIEVGLLHLLLTVGVFGGGIAVGILQLVQRDG